MTYKLLKQGVQRLADGAIIPPSDANMDWRRYQEWLAAGNTPQAADPAPLPASAQAMVNRQRGQMLDDLDAKIAVLPAVQQGPLRLIRQLLKE